MSEPTKKEANELLAKCDKAIEDGSTESFRSYEEGVRDGVLWMQGYIDDPVSEE